MKHIRKIITLAALCICSGVSWAATAAGNGMNALMVTKVAGSTVVKIDFRDSLEVTPSSFSIANPSRLVFDLPGIENALGYSTKAVNEGGLRSLNIVQAGERARLVLNLERNMRHEVKQEGKSLIISLSDDGAAAPTGQPKPLQHFAGVDRPEGQSIRDIQFRRNKEGAGVVVVDMTASDSTIDINQKGTGLQVSFKNTKLPDNLRRQLDVVDFATPITSVKTRMIGDTVAMEIQPKGLWEHTAFQSDNQFIIEVRPVKEDPHKLFQGSKTGYQGEAISLNFQNIPLRELLHVFADITNFNIVVSDSVAGNVSLRLNDVAWDHALEIVLQQKNLAMRKSGNVLWIAPRDELAARDKLEADAREAAIAAEVPRLEVFQMNYKKAEDFAAMLQPGLADKSGSGGEAAPKPAAGSAASASGFLSANGKVTVDQRTNQVFIHDVPSKLELIRGLLAKVDKAARQVLIEARIVEATTSFSKALGARLGGHDHQGMYQGHRILGSGTKYGISGSAVDARHQLPWREAPGFALAPVPSANVDGMTYTTDQTTGITTRTTDFKKTASEESLASSQFANNPVSNALGQFALTLFNSAKTQLLTLELTALESDGKGKTISSPRVLTADQVEATIQDGEKIPYLCSSPSGATAICWSLAVMSLKVTPQITPDGKVLMKIKINKDARGRDVVLNAFTSLPSISTKEVVSEVHVENGGTVVIGGVFTTVERENSGRVPFFGDLPYIGFMFKQTSKTDDRSELIIMLTPRIADEAISVKL